MTAFIRNIVTPPTFPDSEKNRRAQLTHSISGLIGVIAILYGLFGLFSGAGFIEVTGLLLLGGISVLALVLVHRGRVEFAGTMLVNAIWLAFVLMASFLGGISDPLFAGLAISIVLAGVLFGVRGAGTIAVMSVVFGLFLVDAENTGRLVNEFDPVDSPIEIWGIYAGVFAALVTITTASQNGFRSLLRRISEGEQEMRARNWELTKVRQSLEERVQERTEILDRRLQYLNGAAQVATAAGAILDPTELAREVVNLVQEQFGLYYVGLFLLDPVGEWAVLEAGTGSAGEAMITRGHRIRVGEGMVGWSLANNQARFAQQAEQDRVRVVNPDLPDTRAEAAVPLAARGQVIGALTVQSDQVDFFDDDTVLVLQTMADLIAVVLSNARLYAASQTTVLAAQRAYGELSQEAWTELLMLRSNWGYRYFEGMVHPASDTWETETQQAYEQGGVITNVDDSAASVAMPIRVAGNVIGAVNFRRGMHQGVWRSDEVTVLTELVDQVAQALENARLLEESRQLAAREAQLSDLSANLANTLDVDAMLRTAVRELGKLPGVREAAVHLQSPESTAGVTLPEAVVSE